MKGYKGDANNVLEGEEEKDNWMKKEMKVEEMEKLMSEDYNDGRITEGREAVKDIEKNSVMRNKPR